ncbi:hypothetical protein PSE_3740 [Pseudovibrio sp. FO-BEG1]|nr:hypothetical protein PSE_3740 [Pseudovibrio sp. FO-BEG1]
MVFELISAEFAGSAAAFTAIKRYSLRIPEGLQKSISQRPPGCGDIPLQQSSPRTISYGITF